MIDLAVLSMLALVFCLATGTFLIIGAVALCIMTVLGAGLLFGFGNIFRNDWSRTREAIARVGRRDRDQPGAVQDLPPATRRPSDPTPRP